MEAVPDERKNFIQGISIKSSKGDFSDLIFGYFPIQMKDLLPNSTVTFDVFFPFLDRATNTFHMKKIMGRGATFTTQFRGILSEKGISLLHIALQDSTAFMDYLSNGIKTLVASAEAPLEKKMDLLYQNARYLIQKVLSDIPVGKDMERAPQLMDMMADFFAVENITSRFLYSIFSKRYTTFTHSVQVCLLGMAFFNFLGFTKTDSANMGLGSLFHDLGKNFIDPEILDKPGKLTSGEFATVKKHPSLGYEQVEKWGTVRPEALEVILHHHEAMDGNGYPSGLGADQIHPWARIAHIIDCFDALTTDRCYREAVQPFEALRIMGVEMKHSFDKAFLKHFIAFLAL